MRYFVKTPWFIKKIWPSYLWHINTKEKVLYLSFDDGPDPMATPFVLDELNKYNAKATFFCIGKNVKAYPAIYKRVMGEGHAVGNHTQEHLNGYITNNKVYLDDVTTASQFIESGLFRPPYGRIRPAQAKRIPEALNRKNTKIVMWSILSGDFDESISPQKCLENIIVNANSGSLIVFHDSPKAFPRLKYALPGTLDFFANRGFRFEKLEG